MSQIRKDALNLPARNRNELVVPLWDSLAPGEIPLPEWQRNLIRDSHVELKHLAPEERSAAWDAVRRQVFAGKE